METVNAVVDLSHHNGTVNLNQAQKAGILGVIHKATQGRAGVDPTYKANRAKAGKEKLLWGAYHFGTGSDGWFWLAQYGPTAVVPRNWQTWTFWQYTDGAAGPDPHTVLGIGRCDRDRFQGTPEELVAFWSR